VNAKRKRGRPPFDRDKLLRRVHRFVLLWIQVHSLQAEYAARGEAAPNDNALAAVAARNNLSKDALRKLLKRGLKEAPADVRALLAPELPPGRETYPVYSEDFKLSTRPNKWTHDSEGTPLPPVGVPRKRKRPN
jgi:hypothetical protein